MKKYLISAITITLLIFSFNSCDMGVQSRENPGGTISIQLEVPEELHPQTSSAGRNLFGWQSELQSYRITGSGPDGATFDETFTLGSSYEINSLVPGSWNITAQGLNSGGSALCSGTGSTTVSSNGSSQVQITLDYISGTGAVSFLIDWPQEAPIATGTVTLNGGSQAFTVDLVQRQAEALFGSIPAGRDNVFSYELLDASGALVYGTTGTVHVTHSHTTPIAMTISYYAAPPSVPQSVTATAGIFAVDLEWQDSTGETNYLIERRESGSPSWEILYTVNENSTSYRDIEAQSEKNYEYRVVAFNDKGEVQSSPATCATPDFSLAIERNPVALGEEYSLRVQNDGTVMGFGSSRNGALGDFSGQTSVQGTLINGVSDIISIRGYSGYPYILATDRNGQLWQWGRGNPSVDPIRVAGITRPVISTSINGGTYCALDADGQVWQWSYYKDGPTAFVEGLPPIKKIVAANDYYMAHAQNGSVYVWGNNWQGQLGLGDTIERTTPVELTGLGPIKDIAASAEGNTRTSFIIMEDGSVMAAGYSFVGQMGLPNSQYNSFTLIPGLSNIEEIHCSYYVTLALDSSGNLWGAGKAYYGQLLEHEDTSKQFIHLTSAPASIEFLIADFNKVFCRTSSGKNYIWGENLYGDLMVGDSTLTITARQIPNPHNFTSLEAGENHYFAIDDTGAAWGWGSNHYGQLGDGTSIDSENPIQIISEVSPVIDLEASGPKAVALLADGRIFTWGTYTGSTQQATSTPQLFTDIDLGNDVVEVAIGLRHQLALKSDGTVWAWGNNDDGQLGNGTTTDSISKAIQVHDPIGDGSPLAGVISISADRFSSSARLSDGRVVSWGNNVHGNGLSMRDALTPVYADVTSVTNYWIKEKAAFCDINGDLWFWGEMNGIIRNTPMIYSSVYRPVLTGVSKMALNSQGYSTALALLSDGTSYSGGNSNIGYGNGVIYDESYWEQASISGHAADGALTDDSAMVLCSDGSLWFWGYNEYGEAGDGTMVPKYISIPTELTW